MKPVSVTVNSIGKTKACANCGVILQKDHAQHIIVNVIHVITSLIGTDMTYHFSVDVPLRI